MKIVACLTKSPQKNLQFVPNQLPFYNTGDSNCISRSSTATCTADATSGAVEWDFELGEGVDDASFKQCTGFDLNVIT